jgi:hypothetical protein
MFAALCAKLADFRRDSSALAATELAFIAPVLLILGLMGVDTANYVIATEQVEQVANTIGQMMSETGVGLGASTASVSNVDLQFFHDSAAEVFPGVLSDAARLTPPIPWYSDIAISMASVNFSPNSPTCTSNCSYTAYPIWVAGDRPRLCNQALPPQADTSAPAPTALPTDVFPTGPLSAGAMSTIVVVDVLFSYHPIFASYFGGATLTIARSVYISPRYVQAITYLPNGATPGGITATYCANWGTIIP